MVPFGSVIGSAGQTCGARAVAMALAVAVAATSGVAFGVGTGVQITTSRGVGSRSERVVVGVGQGSGVSGVLPATEDMGAGGFAGLPAVCETSVTFSRNAAHITAIATTAAVRTRAKRIHSFTSSRRERGQGTGRPWSVKQTSMVGLQLRSRGAVVRFGPLGLNRA
jgi:hypothetical protein